MKTILFGNGLNCFSKSFITWKQLLDKIKGDNLFENGKLPNTMIYERSIIGNPISFDTLTQKEQAIKTEISFLLKDFPSNGYFDQLAELKVENYLTTNYDYAFLECFKKNPRIKIVNKSTEDIYSVRRHKDILEDGNLRSKLWHIHGDIDTPPSIMLGLDHYCGSVAKIDSYVKGRYEFDQNKAKVKVPSILDKLKNLEEFDGSSWVELFFTSDIHIVGLGLDFSEIDLWWILNKRARFMLDNKTTELIKNKIYFYSTSENEDQRELLRTLSVENILIELSGAKNNYEEAYNTIFEKIRLT